MSEIPAPLDPVMRLVNTVDLESGKDVLTSTDELDRWAAAVGIPLGRRTTEGDLAETIRFREAVRSWLRANHDADTLPPEIGERMNRMAADVRLAPRVNADGQVQLVPVQDGAATLIGTVLTALFRGAADGTLPRLKVCPADTCQWAFYDHSRNRSRTWCSMQVCGNRNKVQAYRTRSAGA